MITIQEAQKLTQSAINNKQEELIKKCTSTLDIINNAILIASQKGEYTILWRWNVSNNKDNPFEVGLCSWDGGDGRGDKITPAGEYIKSQVEKAGFFISMSSGSLEIDWTPEPTILHR